MHTVTLVLMLILSHAVTGIVGAIFGMIYKGKVMEEKETLKRRAQAKIGNI